MHFQGENGFPGENGAHSHSFHPQSHTGYGPRGENHRAVRIRVQIRYTVKTLGPLGTKLDSSKAMFRTSKGRQVGS